MSFHLYVFASQISHQTSEKPTGKTAVVSVWQRSEEIPRGFSTMIGVTIEVLLHMRNFCIYIAVLPNGRRRSSSELYVGVDLEINDVKMMWPNV